MLANGQFFGGGMWVAPAARTDDGRFEIVIIGDVNRREVLTNLPRLYKGTLARHAKVTALTGEDVAVDSDQDVYIQADGELVGKLPATFRIVPSCLDIVCSP